LRCVGGKRSCRVLEDSLAALTGVEPLEEDRSEVEAQLSPADDGASGVAKWSLLGAAFDLQVEVFAAQATAEWPATRDEGRELALDSEVVTFQGAMRRGARLDVHSMDVGDVPGTRSRQGRPVVPNQQKSADLVQQPALRERLPRQERP